MMRYVANNPRVALELGGLRQSRSTSGPPWALETVELEVLPFTLCGSLERELPVQLPSSSLERSLIFRDPLGAAVAEWSRYRIVAHFVTSSSPVPLKNRRLGQRCTLNLSRAQTSSRWYGVVVRRGECKLRFHPRHLTMVQNDVVRHQKPSRSWTVRR
ncbi:uncharacterized protein TNCV_3554311 [Trichonephila clavipes]|nr:uncharacterized protein TNCV_3554311 [Trichonephila clavipes]